jgi:cytochrome c oxidase accessory protein FixG
MFDKDTLIITYDQERGEPRGARTGKNKDTDGALGACIDCSMCVQVCPTGIDIRRGLQYECIGCASCIDACNEVMQKTGAPLGLIRYSTEHAITNHWTLEQIRRRVLRPRILIYMGILGLVVTAFFGTLIMRTPLKLDVIRDRGAMAREVDDGRIENVYRLQIMNTAETSHHYKITALGIDTIKMASPDEIVMDGASTRAVPVRVQVDHAKGQSGSNKIEFKLQALDDPNLMVKEKAVFFVPK